MHEATSQLGPSFEKQKPFFAIDPWPINTIVNLRTNLKIALKNLILLNLTADL